jgi:hypothetical protein
VAQGLAEVSALLPTIPAQALDVDWTDVEDFRVDRIESGAPGLNGPVSAASCDLQGTWPADRVWVGALVEGEEEDYCRVQYKNESDTTLYLRNRNPIGSIHVPVTGEPAWVAWRFPVPPGHEATSFYYEHSWARLFGSHPEDCHENEQDGDGNCTRSLADGEDWSEEVPAGLFLLWTVPGDCEGWHITGPHEPIADLEYSGVNTTEVEVPEHLREAPELAVSALVWHQYPGGCDEGYCVAAAGTYTTLALDRASLQTERLFAPHTLPVDAHPRLFGGNDDWYPDQVAFSSLPCRGEPDYPESSDWGSVTNVRNQWEEITLGGPSRLGEVTRTLAEHEDAAGYLSGEAAENWSRTTLLQLLHLVRRTRACHALGEGGCPYTEDEIDGLVDALIAVEMPRLADEVWSSWSFGFDLRTTPPLRQWTLFADILWEDIDEEMHAQLQAAFDPLVENFLDVFENGHWALFNGNNWTPVLVNGALAWAITYYHEDERAPLVVHRALQSLWLHRDFYLSDGVYREGLSYSWVSFDALLEINRMVERAFGEPLRSVRWDRLPMTAAWALDFVAPDGLLVDFGDSWDKRGWGTYMPLNMLLVNEGNPADPSEPDPCLVQRFFGNKYYYHGMTDPWSVHPALARDWFEVVENCPAEDQEGAVTHAVHAEGGWGAIRTWQVGATDLAQTASHSQRYLQADQTFLAVSAVPNWYSHTELDFATLIWSAYGNRLLVDSGYGDLASDRYVTEPDASPDQNPTGHNTLVVPEALRDGDPSTNTSQIDGEEGLISLESIDGTQVIHLDGAAVYGRDDQALGWLEAFDRWLLHIGGGNFLVIDSFAVRSDRPEAAVEERWHLGLQDPVPTSCNPITDHAEFSFTDQSIDIEPICSMLAKTDSSSHGRIVASSLEPGRFVLDPPVEFINRLEDTEQRTRFRYVPDQPLRSDLRLFALLSSPADTSLPTADIQWSDCSGSPCVTVEVESESWTLGFASAGERWVLVEISAP